MVLLFINYYDDEMNQQKIPNILSIVRILLSLLLFFFFKHPVVFTILYFIVGLSDVLDGFIARKLKAESTLGARLDSIGDFFFYVILIIYLITEHRDVIIPFWIPVLLIFILRIGNILIGFLKYRNLIMIHTIANKISGFMVFALPIMLILGYKGFLLITLIVALWASIEELIIILRKSGDGIDLNKKSLFRK